ncbi:MULTISPECIES: NRDE family protein [unclassified Agarivorans]|uniref:NRDE family protein n=1 Tax=unclassified Agarivorans TaxID=2636026 RepID=UPI003D7C3829
MCTLSLIRLPQQLVITMNRDEARTRHEAGLIQHSICNTQLLYPRDAQAGGSWFGVNNHGVTLALLNRYQDPQHSDAPSRGTIIPQALNVGAAEALEEHLTNQDYRDYNPFDLLMMSPHLCQHYRWNGQQLSTSPVTQKALLFSSSALDTKRIIAKRQQYFAQWWQSQEENLKQNAEQLANGVLQAVHLQQGKQPNESVLMDRQDAHSKSICQVVLGRKNLNFNYYPENSLAHWRNQAANPKRDWQSLHRQQRQLIRLTPSQ